MKPFRLPFALALLAAALAAGCRPEPGRAETYEAWEAGRILIFENPSSQPRGTEIAGRLQKQVLRSVDSGGVRRVETAYTGLQGQQTLQLVLKDGGTALQDGQGRSIILLPEGFPDRVAAWQSPAYRMRVLGRARWGHERPRLASTQSAEGVWVEGEPLQGGTRIRIFYLPDFGEVEKLEWRDGQWVATNLLVGHSFQEIPRERTPK